MSNTSSVLFFFVLEKKLRFRYNISKIIETCRIEVISNNGPILIEISQKRIANFTLASKQDYFCGRFTVECTKTKKNNNLVLKMLIKNDTLHQFSKFNETSTYKAISNFFCFRLEISFSITVHMQATQSCLEYSALKF